MDADLAVRLANEGIPVKAIARAVQSSSADIWLHLEEAQVTGRLLTLPPADWPADSRPMAINRANQETNVRLLRRLFTMTPREGEILLLLLARTEVRLKEISSQFEIARVFVSRLRRRLKPFRITIHSLYGLGYYIPLAQRQRLLDLIKSTPQTTA
jgi:hypothetical protein